MSCVQLPNDVRQRSVELIDDLCGAGPSIMSPGVFSMQIVPDKCFAFVEAIDSLLAKAPGAVELMMVKTSALRLASQNKSAEDVLDAVLAMAPDHFDAGMTQQTWDTWPHVLQLPPCSEQMRRLPPALSGELAEGRNVQLVRDGLGIGIAFVQDITEIRFDHGLSPSMRCQWQFVPTDSPHGRVVAHYVLVEDNPASPYRQEFFLTSGKPEPASASSGYWLLQRLARMDSGFIILARGDEVRYVRRCRFPKAMRDKLQDIADRLEKEPKPTTTVENFQRAVQWHMSHFDFESVRFQAEDAAEAQPERAVPTPPPSTTAAQAPMPNAAQPNLPESGNVPLGWVAFRHPEGLFELAHPAEWQRITPISEDAAFACMGPPPFTLVEVHVLVPKNFHDDEVEREAAMIRECLALEHPRDGSTYFDRPIEWLSGSAWRIVVAYDEKGHRLTTDYFLLDARPHVLMVALKTLDLDYDTHESEFETIVCSVQAPNWSAAPDWHEEPATSPRQESVDHLDAVRQATEPSRNQKQTVGETLHRVDALIEADNQVLPRWGDGFKFCLAIAIVGAVLFQGLLWSVNRFGGTFFEAMDVLLQRGSTWLAGRALPSWAAYALVGGLLGTITVPLLVVEWLGRFARAYHVAVVLLIVVLVGVLARVFWLSA